MYVLPICLACLASRIVVLLLDDLVQYKTSILPVTSVLTIRSPPRGANVVFYVVEWFAKLGFSLGAQTGSDVPRFGEPNNMMSYLPIEQPWRCCFV